MSFESILITVLTIFVVVSLVSSALNVYLTTRRLKRLKKESKMLDDRIRAIDEQIAKARQELQNSSKENSKN